MLSFKDFLVEDKSKSLNGIQISSIVDFYHKAFPNWTPEKESADEEIEEADDELLGAPNRKMSGKELQDYLQFKKKTPGLTPKEYRDQAKQRKKYRLTMPHVHASGLKYLDPEGTVVDEDALKKSIMIRPKKLLKQNEKMIHSDGTQEIYFNLGIPALKGFAVNEKTGDLISVDTCPGAGACKLYCYALKGGYIQYVGSFLSMARILNFLINDPAGFEKMLSDEIQAMVDRYEDPKSRVNKATGKPTTVVVRWHDAGDFFSDQYRDLAWKIARKFPNVEFYAYTKMADVVNSSARPKNFIINFSVSANPEQRGKMKAAAGKKPSSDLVQIKGLSGEQNFKNSITMVRSEMEKAGIGFDTILHRIAVPGAKKPKLTYKSEEAVTKLKKWMTRTYDISVTSILTYDEMMAKSEGNTPKWNVIVLPGEGDQSAKRRDVINTYLYEH